MTNVVVCVTAYNAGGYIRGCIDAILNQTHHDFKLIVIDDGSKDDTWGIIKSYDDVRIKARRNGVNRGIAASRNVCLDLLEGGEYVFFTDSDCVPDRDWLKIGLEKFSKGKDVVCVNGRTVYVSEGYMPRMFEKSHIQTDSWAEAYQTCNIGYRMSAIAGIRFDQERLNNMMEDTDFAIMTKLKNPEGKFISTDAMKVTHIRRDWDIRGFIKSAWNVRYIVAFIKKNGKNNPNMPKAYHGTILNRGYLMLSLFPPGIIYYIIKTRKQVKDTRDLVYVLAHIIKSYLYRILVWIYAIQNKILLI